MPKTNNHGTDYGMGRSNVDAETGIHYGIIPGNHVNPDALEEVYRNGTDCGFENYKKGVEDNLRGALSDVFSDYKHGDNKTSALDDAVASAFDAIEDRIGDHYPGSDGCVIMDWEGDGYALHTDSSGDVWVFKSKYYTHAQFCSPCAPGAGYLANPCDDGPKTYCLHHDWFDDGVAPYPVYSVDTGKEIIKRVSHPKCPNCEGNGRDTVERIARVRQVPLQTVLASILNGHESLDGFEVSDNTFNCFCCDGKGTIEEVTYEQIEPDK